MVATPTPLLWARSSRESARRSLTYRNPKSFRTGDSLYRWRIKLPGFPVDKAISIPYHSHIGMASTTWAERREVYDRNLSAMAEAAEIANRPSFGLPKPVRATLADGRVLPLGITPVKDVLAYFKDAPAAYELVKVEKWWPELEKWETCWEYGAWL